MKVEEPDPCPVFNEEIWSNIVLFAEGPGKSHTTGLEGEGQKSMSVLVSLLTVSRVSYFVLSGYT